MAGCLILVLAAAGGVWVAISSWPPIIIRNQHYRKLISDFKRATLRDKIRPAGGNEGWDFSIQPDASQTPVFVKAVWHGVVRIKYPDESVERDIYKEVDYSSPIEIRTDAATLYVYWVEPLITTDYFLVAYDMSSRREITRRRVDPLDVQAASVVEQQPN